MRTEEGLLLLNQEGAIQWANTAAGELLRYSCEELVQMALPAVMAKAQSPAAIHGPVAAAFSALLAGSSRHAEGDARFPSKGGKRVAVHWQLWMLPAPEGSPQILLALSETAQASAEGPITSSYRDIFEHAVEGIFRSSPEGAFLEVNPALARMYGYASPAELITVQRDLNSGFYVDASRRLQFLALMAQDGFVTDFEAQIFRADGSIIWTAEFARTVYGEGGIPLYFEGSVIDITDRKRAELTLQISEAKFRHLVETTSVVPFEADLQTGRITYVGPQAVQFLGYPLEDWKKPGFLDRHMHEEDQGWVSIVRAEAMTKRQNFECEYRMVDSHGRVVWAREIVSVLPAEERRQSLGGFFLDVSYRREAEESLRESRHFVEQIASASPTILFLYDPNKRQSVYVSGRIHDILGYSPTALSEMHPFFVLSLAHPDELPEHERHLAALQQAEPTGVLEREFRLRNAQGNWVWLHSRECCFKADQQGGVLRMVGTLEDITDHRQAMEELKTNEALFRQLAETTRVVPFDFDLALSRFTYIGPQAEALIRHPLDHWYRSDFWRSVIHPDDQVEGSRFTRASTLSSDEDFETEFRLVTPVQQTVWVRQIVHHSTESNHSHVSGFFIDITAAKLAEEEREQSRRQLRELAARNQIVREEERVHVAREIHDELGQALTSFRLDLSWLGTRLAKPLEEQRVATLQEKVLSMEQLMGRTLQTIRRILSALRPPLLDELGLREAIEWHAQDFAKRLGIRYDLEVLTVDTLPQDSAIAIFRVFQEMLTNVARHAKASRIKISLRAEGTKLILEVEDNGRGIPPERLTGTTSFGLLGMRERAWMVGGELKVVGRPGTGTTVTLTVPTTRLDS